MDNGKARRLQASLFASKGEASPSPGVGYLTVRQLQGLPERRAPRPADGFSDPDRRTPVSPTFGRRPDDATAAIPDGAAQGAEPHPAAHGEARAGLSGLIRRRSRPIPAAPARTATSLAAAQSPAVPGSRTTPATAEAPLPLRQGVERPEPLAPRPSAAPVPPPAAVDGRPQTARRTPVKRYKLTVRLEESIFGRVRALAARSGRTYQSILASAVHTYLAPGPFETAPQAKDSPSPDTGPSGEDASERRPRDPARDR